MKIIALRFGENFAPSYGTIKAHQRIIDKNGFVWFGKFGNAISSKIIDEWIQQEDPKVLLIKSGTMDRYWAHVIKHQKEKPYKTLIPSYYRDKCDNVKCWFKITKIENAPKDIVSKCYLVSTKGPLSTASKISMNPCMYCECEER